jgi:hypothetical protein
MSLLSRPANARAAAQVQDEHAAVHRLQVGVPPADFPAFDAEVVARRAAAQDERLLKDAALRRPTVPSDGHFERPESAIPHEQVDRVPAQLAPLSRAGADAPRPAAARFSGHYTCSRRVKGRGKPTEILGQTKRRKIIFAAALCGSGGLRRRNCREG